jgi:ATP-binding cassette subfamily B protein
MTMKNNRPVSGDKPSNFGNVAKRLLGYFRPYRKKVIMMFIFAVLGVAFLISGPRLLGHSTDIIIRGIVYDSTGNIAEAQINFDALKINLAILLIVYGLSALFHIPSAAHHSPGGPEHHIDLREDVDQKIQRLPLNYYDTHTHGDILSRTTTDIEQISTTIQQIWCSL